MTLQVSQIQDQELEFVIRQGYRVDLVFEFNNPDGSDMNLTGYTYLCQIRSNHAQYNGTVIANLTVGGSPDYLTVTDNIGRVVASISPATTREFPLEPDTKVYFELKLIDGVGDPVIGVAATIVTRAETARS